MNRLLSILTAFFITFGTDLSAQENDLVLKGHVCDEDGPLAGAVILHTRSGTEGPEYAISDSNGNFVLKIHGQASETDSIKVSMLGYATRILPVNSTAAVHIRMETEAIHLNEIIVRAPKVNLAGDTVKFYVQTFAEVQDKSISDVLKRMPGIEVRKDGSISYNGESVDNIYIEGLDMLGGRYSLLTENLSAKDVSSVEVMERHQPIRALAEISTKTGPSINLRLRDRSKGTWIGNAGIAGGLTPQPAMLWDANLFLMRVGRKWNSLNNIKSDNTGKDLSGEFQIKGNRHQVKVQSDDFISIGTGNAPLEGNRIRFNTSALINTSNLWKLKNDWKIRTSLSYLFDKLTSGNETSTTYYFNDSTRTVNESDNTMTGKHRLQASMEAEANRKDYYFRNVLTAEGEFADAEQIKGGEFANTQNATLPYFLVNDDLKGTSIN